MIKAYQGIGGAFKDTEEKRECTHVILTVDEYNNLIRNNNRLADEVKRYESEIDDIKKEAESSNQKAKDAAKMMMEASQRAVEEAREEIEEQKSLNANLLRISRERANADRKLKPKKEHTGYVVKSSQEKEFRYGVGREAETVIVWETTIQSPYAVSFEESVAKKQIEDDLMPANGNWLLCDIGITATFSKPYEELMEDEEFKKKNTIFKIRYRANYQQGYWEVVLTHLRALGPVPENMR